MKPGRRRALVQYLQGQYRVSERRGCAVLRFDRSSHRYRLRRDDQAFLRHRIREIAASRVRYGYRRVYVALRREDRRAVLSVTDHGPGISKACRDRLFRPYSRGTDPDAPPGLGLGLAIALALARAMGGDIEHRTPEHRGTVFRVLLPLT